MMMPRIAPFPAPHSITDAFGSIVEVSHYEVCHSPRVIVEIADGNEIVNAHLTIRQAEELSAALRERIAAAKRDHMATIERVMQSAQRRIAAAGGDNLPPGSGA